MRKDEGWIPDSSPQRGLHPFCRLEGRFSGKTRRWGRQGGGSTSFSPLMITASLSPVGSHTMEWTSPPILKPAGVAVQSPPPANVPSAGGLPPRGGGPRTPSASEVSR